MPDPDENPPMGLKLDAALLGDVDSDRRFCEMELPNTGRDVRLFNRAFLLTRRRPLDTVKAVGGADIMRYSERSQRR